MIEINTIGFKEQLLVKDLIATHKDYQDNVNEWDFLMTVYEGIKEIIKKGYIKKHERETIASYNRRVNNLFGFGYCKSIVEIFHFYLFKKDPHRILKGLGNDSIWKMFVKDSDLYGNDFNSTIMEIALFAAIQGHMGILVDQQGGENIRTKQQQIEEKIYPYLSKYYPKAILDWKFEKNENKRPVLTYLKLLDDDGQYRIWTVDKWEVWELPKNERGEFDQSNYLAKAIFIDGGFYDLGEIPFLWHYNYKSGKIGIGNSDIHEIARIDLSIIKNMSQIEAIIDFAAFPMMRKPMRDAKPTEINAPQQDDEVGEQVILEFDPENPDSKPDWLKAEVAEPVDAIVKVIEKKVAELYRSANVGGMASTEPTKNAQSGVAKRTDFQLLNSKLVSKAMNLEDTENKIIEFWLKWENQWDKYKDVINNTRERTFDLENLSLDLENAIVAKTVVLSETFNALVQKQSARQVLSSATEKEFDIIDKEIEVNNKVDFEKNNGLNDNIDEEINGDIDGETTKIIIEGMK